MKQKKMTRFWIQTPLATYFRVLSNGTTTLPPKLRNSLPLSRNRSLHSTISRKRGLGEFRTEEKLMMEQLLLQDEKRALLELKAEMESRQKASQETHMRMAAMAHVEQARAESQAHAEMMARAPLRASALGSRGSSISMGEQDH